ncbi:hypothetical protein EXIGLDRAFT_764314 [Exidia glandulosa HHB12029]|uniref:GCN1-like HEAT repeats domain-containing protein n=1 Tax=Exidia glandulosa HHB12029 TaxID=1314781 RepID=A0A165L8Q7_EXIGL|nr:hypothetical protein EXIGLDRAFT_764314 [Exidia glandulosa HHB12029]
MRRRQPANFRTLLENRTFAQLLDVGGASATMKTLRILCYISQHHTDALSSTFYYCCCARAQLFKPVVNSFQSANAQVAQTLSVFSVFPPSESPRKERSILRAAQAATTVYSRELTNTNITEHRHHIRTVFVQSFLSSSRSETRRAAVDALKEMVKVTPNVGSGLLCDALSRRDTSDGKRTAALDPASEDLDPLEDVASWISLFLPTHTGICGVSQMSTDFVLHHEDIDDDADAYEPLEEPRRSVVKTPTGIQPSLFLPRFLARILEALDPSQLRATSREDLEICQTLESGFCVHQSNAASKAPGKGKDADIQKWEAELRESLEAKKNIAQFPPYLGTLSALLLEKDGVVAAGSILVRRKGIDAFLDLSGCCTDRLGVFKHSLGVAILRALKIGGLPEETTVEPLDGLLLRVLYRLRSLGEREPLDPASLTVASLLLWAVVSVGGMGAADAENAFEQLASPSTSRFTLHNLVRVIKQHPRREKNAVLALLVVGELHAHSPGTPFPLSFGLVDGGLDRDTDEDVATLADNLGRLAWKTAKPSLRRSLAKKDLVPSFLVHDEMLDDRHDVRRRHLRAVPPYIDPYLKPCFPWLRMFFKDRYAVRTQSETSDRVREAVFIPLGSTGAPSRFFKRASQPYAGDTSATSADCGRRLYGTSHELRQAAHRGSVEATFLCPEVRTTPRRGQLRLQRLLPLSAAVEDEEGYQIPMVTQLIGSVRVSREAGDDAATSDDLRGGRMTVAILTTPNISPPSSHYSRASQLSESPVLSGSGSTSVAISRTILASLYDPKAAEFLYAPSPDLAASRVMACVGDEWPVLEGRGLETIPFELPFAKDSGSDVFTAARVTRSRAQSRTLTQRDRLSGRPRLWILASRSLDALVQYAEDEHLRTTRVHGESS